MLRGAFTVVWIILAIKKNNALRVNSAACTVRERERVAINSIYIIKEQ
jgi:hypothetical protein